MVAQQTTGVNHIRWTAVVGGFLDGIRIEFTTGLNCIIGGRGTGKTTVVELIRYGLDATSDDPQSQKRVTNLIEKNLDFGRVEIGIETKEGLQYIVSRSAGEDPVVLTEDRKPTEIAIRSGNLFSADIFSQNEVEGIADRPTSQLGLIDNFEAQAITDYTQQLRQLLVELSGNASAMAPLQQKADALREELKELPGIEEKLKGFTATGGSDADAINEAHQQKSLRDREKKAGERVGRSLAGMADELEASAGRIEREVSLVFDQDMLDGPNGNVIKDARDTLLETANEVDGYLRKAVESIRQRQADLASFGSRIASLHAEQELTFRELIEKHQAAMGQATERSKLEKLRNSLLGKKHELEETAKTLQRLVDQRTELIQKVVDARQSRFDRRQEIAAHINTSLSPEIQVNITQDGNPEKYRQLLTELLNGSRIRGTTLQRIVSSMWPSDLASLVRSGDVSALVDRAELTDTEAEKLMSFLGNTDALHQLETVELVDEPRIELNDGGTYKDSQSLSTGQKCTTILPILLMESEKPLLIDQPEDNLDNRFVSETVVKNLRGVKTRRQLIFVTHNPNIPVLGDAEGVYVLESDGRSGRKAKSGDVDECKDEIITLLEGGEDAFRQRRERYGDHG